MQAEGSMVYLSQSEDENAIHILKNIEGISIIELTVQDVIRHKLVKSECVRAV